MNPQNLPPVGSFDPAGEHFKLDFIVPDEFTNESNDLFVVRTANSWMQRASKRPIPHMLFDKFWYEGEVCILFADSNLGKSILAVQIADSICKGKPIAPFALSAGSQPVLYCDFELTDKQFETRYSAEFGQHHDFTANFFRAEINPDNDPPSGEKDFDAYVNAQLERSIARSKAKIVIIDNLTYLRSETEQAKDALPLMKHLKTLKNKYGLSILALAHTPKRDVGQPIGKNDLQGSKMLMNFCDSAFTIGESQADKNLRYLKQIKQRNTEQVYGADNVCLCRIAKPFNFLEYQFERFGNEYDHLKRPKDSNDEHLVAEALELKEQGLSLREIGRQMGITHQKVDRLLKKGH